MRIIVTAGPTREYIDSVRFITNASSGRMGYAVAAEAVAAGHDVTLITGPVAIEPPPGCEVVEFVTVGEIAQALNERFDDCEALIMSAAVGDFTIERPATGKISRSAGAVRITLVPTEDILAKLGARKGRRKIVAFAVQEGPLEKVQAEALAEMKLKSADYVVVNTPAAMAAEESYACILSGEGVVLPWSARPKTELAGQIVRLIADPV